MYITFEKIYYLYFLFSIPLFILFHFYNLNKPKKNSLKFANFEAIARIKGIDLYSKDLKKLFLNIIIISLLTLSLSGLNIHKEMNASDFSFIIAIDASQSMSATDLNPTRLETAKKSAIEFIKTLPPESKVGVVSFIGNTYIEEDLTKNKQELIDSIQKIEIHNFGGTDIFEAISISSYMLKGEENKAIILLSDGQLNVGNTEDIIELANKNSIVIHTLGIGTVEGGNTAYGLSTLDEKILKSIAYNTKGEYFKITNKESLESSFKEIAPLTRKMGKINLSIFLGFVAIIIFFIKETLIREDISI